MEFLVWIQDSAFSTWIRESDWALFAFLIVHTISMGFLVGAGIAMDLRILGIAPRVPLALFARLVPVVECGLILAICSGVLLVVGYPAKAITNPIFYLKLALVTASLLLMRALVRFFANPRSDADVAPNRIKALATLGLLLWFSAVTAGKFLPYTHKVLLVY